MVSQFRHISVFFLSMRVIDSASVDESLSNSPIIDGWKSGVDGTKLSKESRLSKRGEKGYPVPFSFILLTIVI